MSKLAYSITHPLGILVIWEAYVQFIDTNFILSAPSIIWQAIVENAGLFLQNGLPTVSIAIAGLIFGLMAAFMTASFITLSKRAGAALTPIVLASQTLPLVAIGPIVSALIGSGLFSQIFITAWLCWFPAVIAFTYGMNSVSIERRALFQVSRATKWQTFIKLQLPGAAKYFASGIRAAAGFALIGAIVMEYGGAQKGLGAMVIQHSIGVNVLSNDVLMALVVLCAVLGVVITWSSYALAKWLLRNYLVD